MTMEMEIQKWQEKKYPECPFLLYFKKNHIACEGLYSGAMLRLDFRQSEALEEHKDKFCCSMNWEKCPIARMLYEKHLVEF